VEAFRREDPPATHKLAVPVSLPTHLIKTSLATKSPKHAAVADLATIAFYYLLRVGEYTFVRASKKRRTKTFRVKDVTFFDSKGVVIPNTAPVDRLLAAAEATLTISNQKNGRRGSCIHHEANNTLSCPIRALARRISHITSHQGSDNDIIATYFDNNGYRHHILDCHINDAVKTAVVAMDLRRHGFPPEAVGSHSLRAGGAMAMHLNGCNAIAIRKQGRWSSDTFLMYIHEQISAFSKGISTAMSTDIAWHNIAGPTVLHDDD
jgi:hypothetical protein